jgi:single-stranded DNA-binding protein
MFFSLYGPGSVTPRKEKLMGGPLLTSVHFTGTVHVAPILKRTRNDRVWVQLLLSVATISRDSKGGLLEESTLIPVSCFRNAGEQAKNLKAGDKVTVIARLRGSRFVVENGTEKHGIQLLAERVFDHAIRDPFEVRKHTLEPPLEIEE